MVGFADFIQPSGESVAQGASSDSPSPANAGPITFSSFVGQPTKPKATVQSRSWGSEGRARIGQRDDENPVVIGEGVPPEAHESLKDVAQEAAAVADLPLGIPAMVAKGLGFTGGVIGEGAGALKTGTPTTRKDLLKAGAKTGEEFAAPLADPAKRLLRYLGYGEDVDETAVSHAAGVFSQWMKKGNKFVEQKTGGMINEEEADQIENAILAGGPVELYKAVKGRLPKGAEPAAARVEPGPLPPRGETSGGGFQPGKATADAVAREAAAPTEADDFIKRMDKESAELAKEAGQEEVPSMPAGKPRIKPKPGKLAEEPAQVERPFADTKKWETSKLEKLATAAEKRIEESKTKFEESKATDRRRRMKSLATEEHAEGTKRLEDELKQLREELEVRKGDDIDEKLILNVHRGTKSGKGLSLPTEGTGLYATTDKALAGKFGNVESFDIKPPKKPYSVAREDTILLHEDSEKIRDPIKESDSSWIKLNKEIFQALEARLEKQGADVMEDSELIKLFGADLSAKLKSQGYDAVQVGKHGDKDSWMVVLDDKLIPEETKNKLKFDADRFQRGKADPKLIAGVGIGAAVGAYAASDDHKVGGAAAGALGGALLVGMFTSKMFAKSEGGVRARELSEELDKITGRTRAKLLELLKFAGSIPKDYKQHAEEIYHSLEDPSIKLSPRATELKFKYVDPIMRQNALLREVLKKSGLDVGEDVDSYVHRILKGEDKSPVFEQFERTSPQGRTLSQFAPPLEERTTFKLIDPDSKDSLFGIKDEKTNDYKVYKNGKVVGEGKISPKLWKEGKVPLGGRVLARAQATTKELETHTPLRYQHDALQSAIASNARLSRVWNNNVFLKGLLKDPALESIALKSDAPKDWREVPQIPQLRGYKFVPRVANVLEDFAAAPGSDLAEGIAKVSRVLTGSLFWNPLPHIWNVLNHAVIRRGLVSGWLNPVAYPRLMRTTIRAAKAVTEQNEEYLRFVKEGAGLMYPNVLLNDFSEKVLSRLGHQSEMGPVAKAWGYANPRALVSGIYAFSRKNLWAANDILMMQAYLEEEMIRPEKAIAEVEKHIPNYKVPDVVLGQRMISQALNSPVIAAFGRYDYGRMRSYGEMIKGLLGKDKTIKDRAKALDQIAMLTFTGAVVYPLLLDNVAKALTGNPNAEATKFGASTIPYLLYSYLHGKKQFSQVLASAFPVGMALKSSIELVSNRDLYTGKHLIEDYKDFADYVAKQLSPLGTAARIESGQLTPGQFTASAVGIRSPMTTAQKKDLAAKRLREKTRKRVDQLLGR